MRYLDRHLEARLLRHARAFKIVLVAGARQVGKSTLLDHVFPDVRTVVFDAVQDLYGARSDPDQFLDTFGTPLVLDEIQYAPELLPALKRRVDQCPGPGQYFITGSQNLAVLRSVSESLAGRVGILRLDGMTPAEIRGQGQAECWLTRYLAAPGDFAADVSDLGLLDGLPPLADFLWRGQLPGVLEFEDEDIPTYFSSYVQTYVERDVRVMADISDLTQFGRFMRLCAALTGQEIFQSQLGRELGVSPKTARRWLDLLGHSYQWLALPAYSGNSIKRLSSKPKGHLQDSGLACYLNAVPTPESVLASPAFGGIFESWGVAWVQRQVQRLPLAPVLYHWRTENRAEVDLVLDYGGRLFPVEFKAASRVTGHDARGILAFRKTYGVDRTAPGVIVFGGNVPRRVTDHAVAVPWSAC